MGIIVALLALGRIPIEGAENLAFQYAAKENRENAAISFFQKRKKTN
jgi:hypothetical protein